MLQNRLATDGTHGYRDTLPPKKELIDYMTDQERRAKRGETQEKIEDAEEFLQLIEKRIGEHIDEFEQTVGYLENELKTKDGAPTFGPKVGSEFDYPAKGGVEELITGLREKRSELSNLKRELKRYIRR